MRERGAFYQQRADMNTMTDTHTTTAEVVAEAEELRRARLYEAAIDLLNKYRARTEPLPSEDALWVSNNVAVNQRRRGRYDEALREHMGVAALADDESIDPRRLAQYHNGYGITLDVLGGESRDAELLDRALVEYAAALYYYEEAGQHRLAANTENNIALVMAKLGRFEEALGHLARARVSCPADEAVRAQVEDTHALIAIEAGDRERAARFAIASVLRLLDLDEPDYLSKSMETLERAAAFWGRADKVARIRAVLESVNWNVTRAASILGYNRMAFKNHLRRHFPEVDKERRNKSVSVKKDE
jgi:tetratricopeptide (TPR) repeat protein